MTEPRDSGNQEQLEKQRLARHILGLAEEPPDKKREDGGPKLFLSPSGGGRDKGSGAMRKEGKTIEEGVKERIQDQIRELERLQREKRTYQELLTRCRYQTTGCRLLSSISLYTHKIQDLNARIDLIAAALEANRQTIAVDEPMDDGGG